MILWFPVKAQMRKTTFKGDSLRGGASLDPSCLSAPKEYPMNRADVIGLMIRAMADDWVRPTRKPNLWVRCWPTGTG